MRSCNYDRRIKRIRSRKQFQPGATQTFKEKSWIRHHVAARDRRYPHHAVVADAGDVESAAIAGDIKDIWALQPRFDQRSGKRPYGVLEQPRFKAAYDFLLLRAESGEVDDELAQWWTDFMNRDGDARAAMLLPPKPDEAKKRKRRKRKPAAANPE